MTQSANLRRAAGAPDLTSLIQQHSAALSAQLQAHNANTFSPHTEKSMRHFSPAETARLIGIGEAYLRQIAAERPELDAAQASGRRSYSVEDMDEIRKFLDQGARGTRRYLPHRRDGEELQVIAVMNFKGGSGKTTTSAHLAQYLALRGYRVLAIDLDPQASLSALFGHQPEIDVGPNETLYGAIRYDDERRPIAEIVRGTYIPNLHIVPGNLELMEFEHDTPRALMRRAPGDTLFFARIGQAIAQAQNFYDVVVIDCPPQLGYLTLTALTAATSVLITIHPQMLDVMSMGQFLLMLGGILKPIRNAGAEVNLSWYRYLITRYEPGDVPQAQMVAFMRTMFHEFMLKNEMLKSTAVSDAGITKQTLYEVDRATMNRATYDRALDSLDAVNGEIAALIHQSWGR